ncbi:MAG: hypothetical protein AB1485_02320 [Candidatus Thermoplasmatota archaeon]
MTPEESKIDRYSKFIGLGFFFLGIAFLMMVFILAYQLYITAETLAHGTPPAGKEPMEAMMGTSIVIGAKFLALSILGLVGSWIANKGIMMVKGAKVERK